MTVLPVWVYLTSTESGRDHASWGKRRADLHVTSAAGGDVGWRVVAVRDAVKLLPCQLAHVAVARISTGADEWATIWATYALSLLPPGGEYRDGLARPAPPGLHDRVANSRVVRV